MLLLFKFKLECPLLIYRGIRKIAFLSKNINNIEFRTNYRIRWTNKDRTELKEKHRATLIPLPSNPLVTWTL